MRMRAKHWIVIIAALSTLLFLAGCGSTLTMEAAEDGKGADIVAENADDGDFMTGGSLIVDEGESLMAEYVFDQGGEMDIKLIPAIEGQEDASASDLEEMVDESESALDMILSGSGTTEYDVPPGDYYISVVVKGKTSGSATLTVQAAEEYEKAGKAGSEDGQNPVMNYIGPYVCDRAKIMIEADGDTDAKVTVTWGGSDWETAEWTMSGPFDLDSRTIEYHNCVKKELVYDDDGNITSEEEVFRGGHGFLKFGKKGKLKWQEDQEHVADGMKFTFNADAK